MLTELTKTKGARGVYAAVATPVSQRFEPDLARLVAHCKWLLANGCDGLAPLGTTGEANSLSGRQRRAIIDALGESDIARDKLIVGAGSCALDEAVELTRAVAELGAEGALLLPPFYYKGPSEEGLFRFFSETIERVGSSSLGVYLYHFPAMSSVPIPVSLVLRLKKVYGEAIKGVKDSSGDWAYTERLLSEIPGFAVFSGSEEFLLRNLQAGGPGCISATTNVTCGLAREVYRHWRSDQAAALQAQTYRARSAIQRYPMQAAVKELIARRTDDSTWRNLLPPNAPLSEAQRASLLADVGALI